MINYKLKGPISIEQHTKMDLFNSHLKQVIEGYIQKVLESNFSVQAVYMNPSAKFSFLDQPSSKESCNTKKTASEPVLVSPPITWKEGISNCLSLSSLKQFCGVLSEGNSLTYEVEMYLRRAQDSQEVESLRKLLMTATEGILERERELSFFGKPSKIQELESKWSHWWSQQSQPLPLMENNNPETCPECSGLNPDDPNHCCLCGSNHPNPGWCEFTTPLTINPRDWGPKE